MAKKYRYVMSGMFDSTDGEDYEINIPSPFTHDTEEDAMKDGEFGYRFIQIDASGPIIVIFEREKFDVIRRKDETYLRTWIEGDVLKTYTFDEFKAVGGYMRMLKPECRGRGLIHGGTDFIDTDKTFKDVFPNIESMKLYYIDNEAYSMMEVEE